MFMLLFCCTLLPPPPQAITENTKHHLHRQLINVIFNPIQYVVVLASYSNLMREILFLSQMGHNNDAARDKRGFQERWGWQKRCCCGRKASGFTSKVVDVVDHGLKV
jgi:hypothetical protein